MILEAKLMAPARGSSIGESLGEDHLHIFRGKWGWNGAMYCNKECSRGRKRGKITRLQNLRDQ